MRIRILLKYLALGIPLLLVVALIVVAILNYRASRRLNEKLEALRAAGEPLALQELSGEPVPADQNAAARLAQLKDEIAMILAELKPLEGEENAKYIADNRLTDEGADLVRGALEDHSDLFARIEQAAAAPAYRPLLDLTQDPNQVVADQLKQSQQSRSLLRVLKYRADLQLHDGQPNEAVHTGLIGMSLARQLDHEPFIVAYLVSLAARGVSLEILEQALMSGPVDPQLREAIETQLAQHDDLEGMLQALRTERVLGIAMFRDMVPATASSLLWWFKDDESAYLELMGEQIMLGTVPHHAASDKVQALQQGIPKSAMLTQLVQPAADAVRRAVDRVRAQMRGLRLANRMQAYVAEHDEPPPSLEALELPDEALTDPFSGDPLKTSVSDHQWLIYSVGFDGQDDSGREDSEEDIVLGPFPEAPAAGEAAE